MKKLELVDNWRSAWKWASVRLAALVGILATVFTAQPDLLLGLVNMLPEGPLRLFLSVAVGAVVFGIPLLTRIFQKCVHSELKEGHDGKPTP